MSGKKVKDAQPLPPLIAHLVESARAVSGGRYATVLAQFGDLAVTHVTSCDILSLPDAVQLDDEPHKRLKAIAAQHLRLADLERQFETVVQDSTSPLAGDHVMTALNDMLNVRDTAHILWGLSLGLALAERTAGGRR